MTFAEFERLPNAPGKQELIDGELIELPPPKHTHAKVAKRFHLLLVTALGARQVWHEGGYRIGGGWLQPDVSVAWPEQRLEDDYLIGAPMIAIEVLSPVNTAAQIERKITLGTSRSTAVRCGL